MSAEQAAALLRIGQDAARAEQTRRTGEQQQPTGGRVAPAPVGPPSDFVIIPPSPAMAIGVNDGVEYMDGPRGPGQVQRDQPGWHVVAQAPRVRAGA